MNQNPLLSIPGLGGYVAAVDANQQRGLQQLQQAQLLMGLRGAMEKQQQEQAYKADVAALGPNATTEQLAGVVAKYSPEKALDIRQKHEDKLAALDAKREEAANRLTQQKQYADAMHEFRMGRLQNDAEKQAETVRHNQFREQLMAEGIRQRREMDILRAELMGDRQKAAQMRERDKSVQMLSAALEKANLPEMHSVLGGVESALKKTPKLAEYVSGASSSIPDIALGADPRLSKEEAQAVREGRQAFQKLFNITLKDRSGAAVTNQELERLKAEFAAGVFKKPEQLNAAVAQARKIITDHYRSVAAGFGPDALTGYNDNLKALGGSPVIDLNAPPPSAPPPSPGGLPKVANDADYDKLPSGAEFIDPNGKKRKKP